MWRSARDGKRVVTGSADNTARVWVTPPVEESIPLARSALTRGLTIAQRDALGLPIIPAPGWTASTSVRRPVREPAREGRCVFGILEPLRREPFKLLGAPTSRAVSGRLARVKVHPI